MEEQQTTLSGSTEAFDYTLKFDGSAENNPGSAGYGFVIESSDEQTTGSGYIGETTNNVAEYKALLAGLKRAIDEGIGRLKIQGDSELVIKQVNGGYDANDSTMEKLRNQTRGLLTEFDDHRLTHIGREENTRADELAVEARENNC